MLKDINQQGKTENTVTLRLVDANFPQVFSSLVNKLLHDQICSYIVCNMRVKMTCYKVCKRWQKVVYI